MRRMLTVLLSAAFACAALSVVKIVGAQKGDAGPDSNSRVRVEGVEKSPRPLMPAHTFSIVARDPATGEMGVAVQSHWFSVGSNVAWAEAGVGAKARSGRAHSGLVSALPRALPRALLARLLGLLATLNLV